MKLLTATTTSQGTRENDYSWTVEGELVGIDEPCGKDRSDPDGGCGCGRGFFGMSSHRATTTALVRDLPLTREDVMLALSGYYESGGYGRLSRSELVAEVDDLVELGALWPDGSVIERRLDVVRLRSTFA